MALFKSKNIIKIKNEDLNYVQGIIEGIEDVKTRKRAFVSLVGLSSLAKYLFKEKIDADTSRSLYRINKFLKDYEVADIYVNDIRIETRVVIGNEFPELWVPKTHFKDGLLADIYVGVRIGKDFKEAEIVGFIQSKNMLTYQSGEKYYFIESSALSPIAELKKVLSTLNPFNDAMPSSYHTKAKESYLSFLDGDILHEDRAFLLKHLAKCNQCRLEFMDFCEFHKKSCLINSISEEIKDYTLHLFAGDFPCQEEEVVIDLRENEETEDDTIDDFEGFSNEEKAEKSNHNSTIVAPIPIPIPIVGAVPPIPVVPGIGDIAPSINISSQTVEKADSIMDETQENLESLFKQIEETSSEDDLELIENNEKTESELFDLSKDENLDQDFEQEEQQEEQSEELLDLSAFLEQEPEKPADFESLVDFPQEDKNEDDLTLDEDHINPEVEVLEVIDETSSDDFEILEEDNMPLSGLEQLIEEDDLTLDEESQNVSEEQLIEEESESLVEADVKEEFSLESNLEPLNTLEEEKIEDLNEDNELVFESAEELNELEEIDTNAAPLLELEEEQEEPQEALYSEDINFEDTLTKDQENVEPSDLAENEDEIAEVDEFTFENVESIEEPKTEEKVDGFNFDSDFDLAAMADSSEPQEDFDMNLDELTKQIDEMEHFDEDLKDAIDPNVLKILFEGEQAQQMDEAIKTERIDDVAEPSPVVEKLKDKKILVAGVSVAALGIIAGALYFTSMQNSQNMQNADLQNKMDSSRMENSQAINNSMTPPQSGQPSQPSGMDGMPPAPQQPVSAVSQKPSKDINEAVSKAFGNGNVGDIIRVQKVSWDVPSSLANDSTFYKYLQLAGRSIKLSLSQDLVTADDYAFNDNVRVSIKVNFTSGTCEANIAQGSGSNKLDAVILQSIKETLSYTKVPKITTNKRFADLTLIVNL